VNRKDIQSLAIFLCLFNLGCNAAKIGGAIGILGAGVRIIGGLPDIPPAPGQVTPTPTPANTATLTPVPSEIPPVFPTPTPTAVPPSPTVTPGAVTPAPSPTLPPPVGRHPGQACMLDGPPWLNPAPPSSPVKAEQAVCPKGFRAIDYTDSRSGRFRRACIVDWQCAAGTNGRSLAEGASISIPGHIRLDDAGYVTDVDNGAACGGDAWGRKVCDGVLAPPPIWEGKEEKWWAQAAACDPPKCEVAPTPAPTPVGPRPTPNTSCAPVEAIEHWIVGGGGCHAHSPTGDGRIKCVLDSTVRPICDDSHADNWNSFCGQRTHDPDYDSPAGAQLWTIDGAEDRGPNPANSAQRIIVGSPGAEVHVTVCLRPDARTVDGCRIPIRGDACNRTVWNLPQ
jgi:hypothetical protein